MPETAAFRRLVIAGANAVEPRFNPGFSILPRAQLGVALSKFPFLPCAATRFLRQRFALPCAYKHGAE